MSRKRALLCILIDWIHSVPSCRFIIRMFVCQIHIVKVGHNSLFSYLLCRKMCLRGKKYKKKGNKEFVKLMWMVNFFKRVFYLQRLRNSSGNEINHFDQHFGTSGFADGWCKPGHAQRLAGSLRWSAIHPELTCEVLWYPQICILCQRKQGCIRKVLTKSNTVCSLHPQKLTASKAVYACVW